MKAPSGFSVSCFVLAMLYASPAFAADSGVDQPQEPATPAHAAAPDDGEIVVTARRRDERLLDVPVAVSALSSETLERYATNSLAGIAVQVPQLVIGDSQNPIGGSINLRGIGAGTSNPSTEQAVSLNLDGVPVSYGNAVRLGQLDLQRVEVLRGPQALFFGKNSPAGIISLVSKDPGSTFEAQLRTGYEFAADQKFIEGIISVPLGPTVGARMIAYYSKEDGWFRNIGVPVAGITPGPATNSLNGEEIFLRGTLAFASPDLPFSFNLKVNYNKKDRDGVGPAGFGQLVNCPTGSAQVSGGLTTDCKLDRNFTSVIIPADVPPLNSQIPADGVPFISSEMFLISLTANYDLNESLKLTSVTGYYKNTEDSFDSFTFATVPAISFANDVRITSFTQELRLASDFDGPLNFLAGGFYQDSEFKINSVIAVDRGAPSLLPVPFYDQDTNAWSLFAQVSYKLTPTLELSAGARYSHEKKSLEGTINGSPFEILNPNPTFNDFSPELTLTYKPHQDLTAYASYREGFTSGGFNMTVGALRTPAAPALPLRDISFDQMTVRGGEAGLKGYVLDRQLRFDATVYHYKYKGLQLSKFDSVAIAQTTQNAGGARIQGVELNSWFRPNGLRNLELRGAVAFNDAEYTDFLGGCYAGQSVAAGCNQTPRNPALNPATFGTAANPFTEQDQSGQAISRAPKWSLMAGFTYDFELGNTWGGSVSFDTTYTSGYMTQIEAQPEARQDGYWLLNANVSLHGGPDSIWEVSLIGRNLTNEIVRISGGATAFTGTGTGTSITTGADLFGTVNSPRAVLLQLKVRT